MPFSKKYRYRLGDIYSKLKNPFFGPELLDLHSILKNDNLEIKICPLKSNLHNTTEFELVSIIAILKDNNCNKIFEIGTYDGRTTRAMAMNLFDEYGKVYTLNLPPGTNDVALKTSDVDVKLSSKLISGNRFMGTIEHNNIEQLWGDSAEFNFDTFYNTIDLVFIDGAHSESYVKNDTEMALKMLNHKGGWIIWHDAPFFGVSKFLKKWIANGNKPIYFIKGTSLAIAFVKNGKVSKP